MKLGLVLSGGGAKSIAQIGAIKAFEEFDLIPTHVAGTSAGAVVGALYAAGVSWTEMLHFFKSTSLFTRTKFAYNKPGFINTDKFYKDLHPFFPSDNFSQLQKPLFITATNILNGTLQIFSEGELIKPILASASFPGVFTPVEIENNFYIDGGTLNNFPTEPLKNICDNLIGVYVNPLVEIKANELKNSYSVMERAFKINTSVRSLKKFSDCSIVISPLELNKYGTFSVNDLDTIFNIGYHQTLKILKENPKVIEKIIST